MCTPAELGFPPGDVDPTGARQDVQIPSRNGYRSAARQPDPTPLPPNVTRPPQPSADPHSCRKTLKLSNDPLFVDKVYDVVGLYLNPPESAVVLCVDEKSQVQALGRSQPAFPMMPGMPEKRTHDYVRNGTTSLFAAFNTADGTVISSLHRRHRSIEFKKFLDQDRRGSPRRPGRAPDLRQLQHPQDPRRENMAGTPTPGSRCISPQRIPAGSTRSSGSSPSSPKTSCNAAITTPSSNWKQTSAAWMKDWNTHPKPFIWTKSADEILESLGRLLKRISGAGH